MRERMRERERCREKANPVGEEQANRRAGQEQKKERKRGKGREGCGLWKKRNRGSPFHPLTPNKQTTRKCEGQEGWNPKSDTPPAPQNPKSGHLNCKPRTPRTET